MARPRKFDEVDVVTAARRQFNETGFHGTSVDELSQATGLSKGSLYGAFGDKEALFQRVLDAYCESSIHDVAELLEGPDDSALERVRAWLRVPPSGGDLRGCLLARATAELAWENETVAERSRETYEALIESCAHAVEQAQRAGLVEPDADPQALGAMIVAAHRGIESLGKSGVATDMLIAIADATVDSIAAAPADRAT